jgi:hypothetical protein
VQLYRYFVSQPSEFCLHNPLYCFSTSNAKGKSIFLYRCSPETFGYTLVQPPPTPRPPSTHISLIKFNSNPNYNSREKNQFFIALGYGLDDRGSRVRFPAGSGNFSLHHRVQNGSGAHPAAYPMDTRYSFLGVKRPRREADH